MVTKWIFYRFFPKHFCLWVIVLAISLFSFRLSAQTESLDSLMNLGKYYQQQKDYLKANEYYEQVIDAIKPIDNDGRLTDKIKGSIAINNIYLGIPLFKGCKYAEALSFFEKALRYSERDEKVFPVANSWMGNCYSSMALEKKLSKDLQQSIEYSIIAEKYYVAANASEKRLKEQISRATILGEIAQTNEAKMLLSQVISECERDESRTDILAKALNSLGAIELKFENFQSAIQHLERSFNLSADNDKPNALIAAKRLLSLYEKQIPDKSKAELWKNRVDKLNGEIQQ